MQASAAPGDSSQQKGEQKPAPQRPACPRPLKHFERPWVTSVRSVVNVEKKNDAGSSGCEHAPEQAGTPSAAVTPPRMDAGATGGS